MPPTSTQIQIATSTVNLLREIDRELDEAGYPDADRGLVPRLKLALRDRVEIRNARDHCVATLVEYENAIRATGLRLPELVRLANATRLNHAEFQAVIKQRDTAEAALADMRITRDALALIEATLQSCGMAAGDPAATIAELVKVWRRAEHPNDDVLEAKAETRRVETTLIETRKERDAARHDLDVAINANTALAIALTTARLNAATWEKSAQTASEQRDRIQAAHDALVTDAQENTRVARQEIASLTLRIDENRAVIAGMTADLVTARRERDALKRSVADGCDDVKRTLTERDQARQLHAEMATLAEQRTAELAALQTKYDALNSEARRYVDQGDSIRAEIATERAGRRAAEAANDANAKTVTNLRGELFDAGARMSGMERKIGDLQSSVTRATEQRDRIQSKYDALVTETATLLRERSGELTAARHERDGANAARDRAERTLNQLRSAPCYSCRDLRTQLDTARKHASGVLAAELKATLAKVADMERQVELLTADVKVFREQRDHYVRANTAYAEQIETLTKRGNEWQHRAQVAERRIAAFVDATTELAKVRR